jgi:hypothetical protein
MLKKKKRRKVIVRNTDGLARGAGKLNRSVQVWRRRPRREKEGSQRGQRRKKRRKERNRVMAGSGKGDVMNDHFSSFLLL